jgi:nitrite reductase/ring-hydroxylating ferredoxin subunit
MTQPFLSRPESPSGPESTASGDDEPALVAVLGDDGRDYVVVTARGVAMERWCPHQEADLLEGAVVGSALKCPLHGYMFSLKNGKGLNCRFKTPVRPARYEDGAWRVDTSA